MIPSTAGARNSLAYRRRTLYVDSSIQRSLLVAMVVLEVTLVAAAIGFAYWRLLQLIDASMYRMNFIQSGPDLVQFSKEGFGVLGLFAVLNIVALIIASGIWSRHENLVLRDFTRLIEKTKQLDFSGDAETQPQHEVLALAAAWRTKERIRFAAIRDQVSKLEAAMSANESPQDIHIPLASLKKLLA